MGAMFRACASACLAGLFVLGSPVPVAAQDAASDIIVEGVRPDLRRQVVRVGDLDLTRREGQQEMMRRVAQAVYALCGSVDPVEMQARMPCREQAWASARPQMERLMARARTGQ